MSRRPPTRAAGRLGPGLLLAAGLVAAPLLAQPAAASAATSAWAATPEAPAVPKAALEGVRVDGDQVRFVLTATGLPAGAALDPTTVRVTLDGAAAPATATTAAAGTAALPTRTVLVLLDGSTSMAGGVGAARKAALDFARGLPADVRVGLLAFADTPRLVLGPTTDRAAMAAALASARADGGTALYDALGAALSTLDGTAGVRRIVVLSDGGDTRSRVALEPTLARLRTAGVPVDVVAFRFADDPTGLRRLAAASGGRVLAAADSRGLAAAFTAAAGVLDQRLDVTAPVPTGLAGRRVPVAVRVTAGAAALTASVELAVPGTATAARVHGAGGLWVVAGPVFAALLCLGLLAGVLLAGPDERQRRLAQLARYRVLPRPGETPGGGQVRSPLALAALSWTDRLVTARGIGQAVAYELDRAGVSLKVQEWMLLRACGCAGLAALLVVLTGWPVAGAIAGVAIGWLGSRAWLAFTASRRCAEFGNRLPDLLQLVAGSLKSGFSLPQALDSVVRDGTQPVAGEISRALAEARLGVDLEDGLDAVARRMRNADLGWTVMAIRIQRAVGGNLADVLLTTVHTMRERAQVRRQVRALTAEGRLSAYILVALPVAVGGWLFLTRRDYMRPLYTEPIGIGMLLAAGVLMVVGSFWMSRLVKVEV